MAIRNHSAGPIRQAAELIVEQSKGIPICVGGGRNGRLREASVRRSSGSGALDEAALTILKLASPFEPFPADLATGYSQLRFAYQWDFVAGALHSGAVTVSSDTSKGP